MGRREGGRMEKGTRMNEKGVGWRNRGRETEKEIRQKVAKKEER